MLAVVKTPRTEISLNGEGASRIISWLSRKFKVEVISEEKDSVEITETDFWKEMESNRVGHLLAGARHKAGKSQKQLADLIGIKQTMISDYETGRRRLTKNMAYRLAEILNVKPSRFQ